MARRKVVSEANGVDSLGAGTGQGYFEEPLECILSDEEQKDRGRRLADVDKRIDVVDAERREKAKGYSSQLKDLRKERAPLIEAVETGKEMRPVKCQEVHNFERNNVTVIRTDTQATVRERAMEAHERDKLAQPNLIDDAPQGSA